MPVKLLCSAPADHVLAQVQAASFCSESEDGIPFEYRPGTVEYKEALRKLAYAIAQVLKTVPPKQRRRAAVYLATDFKAPSEKLRVRCSIISTSCRKTRMALPGLSPEQLQESLEGDFACCFASIHPLSNAPFAKTLIEAQLDFARKQTKPRLVWTPERPDDLTNTGFEWFTSQVEIEDRIRRLHDKPAESKSAGTDQLIYFLCPDRANKTRAEPLLDALEKRGVHIYSSPLDGTTDQAAMQTHVRALDELDGCLIYYGDVGRRLVRRRLSARAKENPAARAAKRIFLANIRRTTCATSACRWWKGPRLQCWRFWRAGRERCRYRNPSLHRPALLRGA